MSQGFNEDKLAKANLIRDQLRQGRQMGAGHMIRMVNTSTGEEFPLYVDPKRSPRDAFAQFIEKNGTNYDPIECYDFDVDLENQVLADRTTNWDRHLPVQTGPFSGVVPWTGEGPKKPPDDPEGQR
jgi:hypothetical protein